MQPKHPPWSFPPQPDQSSLTYFSRGFFFGLHFLVSLLVLLSKYVCVLLCMYVCNVCMYVCMIHDTLSSLQAMKGQDKARLGWMDDKDRKNGGGMG